MMGKLWHNTTAHYNGYFNADELMTLSFLTLEQQHQDNYNQMLPMYEYIATDNQQAVASDLDEAIKKVSVVVNLHRESNWTDDCYLLVGKAQFLKKDYESAEETLRYMTEEFSPAKMAKLEKKLEKSKKGKSGKSSSGKKVSGKDKEDNKEVLSGRAAEKARKKYNRELKKKRKQDKKRSNKKGGKKKSAPKRTPKAEDEKPVTAEAETPAPEPESTPAAETEPAAPTTIRLSDSSTPIVDPDPPNYFMKHRPAYQEGVLWLAKTLIERDNYDNALRLLNQLERDPNTFNDVRDELAGVQAYYFIKRKDYPQAITYLEQAIDSGLDRNIRARFAYIKAQLHQRMGQGEAAYNTFDQVLKLSNIYELEFSARLNMAQNQWRSGQGSGEDARRNLEKMLKDPKNAEYADQIYYALGEIALESGNRAEAIAYFQKSLNSGSRNSNQRAEAYYRLGRLFYQEETYIDAKAYFDSTLQVMPATDDRYQEVKKYANNLTDIATNLQTIILQDSMLRISQMSEEDRLAMASQIKKEQDEAKLKARLAAEQATASNAGRTSTRSTAVSNRGALKKESSFFAYNDRALKSGKRAFERKWGNRPLEDDWRRSNRTSSFGTDQDVAIEETTVPTIDPNNVSEYLGDFPKTEAEVEKAHSQIREAMYKLGTLYRERLENHTRTVDILERLNERYPGSNYELDSWYVLYLSYKDLNNQAKADEYFKKIIEKFPNSNYAKLLKDPNYASQYLNEERKLNLAYDQVYNKFSSGQYQEAYDLSQEALKKLVGQHPLKPKYALLMAMCSGKLQGKDAYVKDLQRVVATYPDSDEQKRAKEILRALGVAGARLPGDAEEASSAFTYNENELHYIMIVFPEGQENVNQLRNEISDYNEKYHKLDKIRPASIYVGKENKTPVIVLRRWKDKNAVMRYYEGVQKNKSEFITDGTIRFELMPISQNNYRQIIRARSVDGYKQFFDSNY